MNAQGILSFLARTTLALCALVALAGTALAQAPASPRPAAPSGAPGGNVPAGRIAIINTSVFPDRINELQRKLAELNTRFEPRTKELQALRDTISGIEAQVNQGAVAPGQTAQLSERYEQLKKDYTRKSEDLSKEAQKAYGVATEPIREKMGNALQQYAAARNIVFIIDVGGAIKTGSLFYAAPNTNITEDFIASYNKANP